MKTIGGAILVLILLATIASAIGVVWARHESRVLFVQLTVLSNQRDDLNIEFGRLELEQATWGEPRRIDTEARERFGLVPPRPQDIQLVTR